MLDPDAEDLLAAVSQDAERDVDGLVADKALIADLDPDLDIKPFDCFYKFARRSAAAVTDATNRRGLLAVRQLGFNILPRQ